MGGAWILGIVAMIAASVLFITGDSEIGPAHSCLAWPLVVIWLTAFITARFLQKRYERPAPPE